MKKVLVRLAGVTDDTEVPDISHIVLQEVGGHRILRIVITSDAGTYILATQGLKKVKHSRPLPHELIRSILRALHKELRAIEIIDYSKSDNIFYARLLFESGETMDACPSDAVPLAILYDTPIYVAEPVMESMATSLTDPEGVGKSSPASLKKARKKKTALRDPLVALSGELERAIEKEEYERAAEIRDKIRRQLRLDERTP
jgi:uncharacterized protein